MEAERLQYTSRMEDQQEGHDTTRWDTPKMVKLCEPVVHLHQHVCSWYTELDKPKQLPKHSLCLLIGIGYVMDWLRISECTVFSLAESFLCFVAVIARHQNI